MLLKIKAPLKARGFHWLVIYNANLNWDNLRKIIWQGLNMCLCQADEESIDHLFLGALIANIWEQLRQRVNLSIMQLPILPKDLWSAWRVEAFIKTERVIWELVVVAYSEGFGGKK